MNREHVLYHMLEAEDELRRTLADLKEDRLSAEAFQVQMEHLYTHLNIAWNVRAERPAASNVAPEVEPVLMDAMKRLLGTKN